jgi:hypothetical protein
VRNWKQTRCSRHPRTTPTVRRRRGHKAVTPSRRSERDTAPRPTRRSSGGRRGCTRPSARTPAGGGAVRKRAPPCRCGACLTGKCSWGRGRDGRSATLSEPEPFRGEQPQLSPGSSSVSHRLLPTAITPLPLSYAIYVYARRAAYREGCAFVFALQQAHAAAAQPASAAAGGGPAGRASAAVDHQPLPGGAPRQVRSAKLAFLSTVFAVYFLALAWAGAVSSCPSQPRPWC